MAENLINLYSDTQTRPTPAMRLAMAEAPVGDEQKGEDPSVNRLCAMTAELVGKEDAVSQAGFYLYLAVVLSNLLHFSTMEIPVSP